MACFLAGVILLFSGATPAEHDRLHWLRQFLPLSVLEASHFLGSIVGAVLILLAHGMQRRLDSAYWGAIVLLSAGLVASLLKGFDFEEAIYLALLLAALIPCRQHFYRHSGLFSERFSPAWLAAVALVLGCTAWLMLFTYKHVEYSKSLWWEFAFNRDAPRTLRAGAGVLVVVLIVALAGLFRARRKPPAAPNADELAAARTIALSATRTYAQLVSLGDKSLLFSDDRSAFLMFGVEGRSWIALGHPVGPEEAAEELAWRFREMCDEGGRWPVFYQVETDHLPLYIDLGLTMLKLGEEARVPLTDFSLEGKGRKSLRHTSTKVERDGCTFELVDPPHTESLLVELEGISSAWLDRKNTREKGFSLGFFSRGYLSQSPLGLVRCEGQIVAFANLLRGGGQEEITVDLMRFTESAPNGTMDFLFAQLMLRGREEGFQWFNLGMAPLAGVEGRRLAPAWNRVAEIIYRHGEHFYNFQGLREYKEKFDPVWEPKFLASPGGLRLPIILANLATLISGGAKGLVGK
jgi:phosphatidylglycerol lysyltransferase